MGLCLQPPRWSCCSSNNFQNNVITLAEVCLLAAQSQFEGCKVKHHSVSFMSPSLTPSLLGEILSRIFFESHDFCGKRNCHPLLLRMKMALTFQKGILPHVKTPYFHF